MDGLSVFFRRPNRIDQNVTALACDRFGRAQNCLADPAEGEVEVDLDGQDAGVRLPARRDPAAGEGFSKENRGDGPHQPARRRRRIKTDVRSLEQFKPQL